MIITMRTLILFFIFIFNLSASIAYAQITGDGLNSKLGIVLMPANPQPGEETTASLDDYSGGAYGASIRWFIDDTEVPNSFNQRKITFTAAGKGTQKVKAVLNKPIGGTDVLQKVISPAYLDIIVEPQTRVPDFYQGRSLPSIGSTVNATALLSGDNFRNTDLMYVWKVNNKVIDKGAIRGRNQVSFTVPMGREVVLSVQINELNGNIISQRSVIIPSIKPEMLFYEVNSLFGINEKSINKQLSLIGNSTAVRAEPYYLDINVYNNPAIHEWKVTGGEYTKSSNPYEISIQRDGIFSRNTNLSLQVRDTKQLLQGAEGNVNINF